MRLCELLNQTGWPAVKQILIREYYDSDDRQVQQSEACFNLLRTLTPEETEFRICLVTEYDEDGPTTAVYGRDGTTGPDGTEIDCTLEFDRGKMAGYAHRSCICSTIYNFGDSGTLHMRDDIPRV